MTVEMMIFVLTVLSVTGTLAGFALAIYGYFNVHTAERIVEKKMKSYMQEIEKQMATKMAQSEEAMHKILTAYTLSAQGNHERAIDLLEAAVRVHPHAFNGYTALAYEYWTLGKHQEAIECFFDAIRIAPDRPEPYNDLARAYAQIDKPSLALKYIKESLDRNPNPYAYKDIEEDPVFDSVRAHEPNKYEALMSRYRAENGSPVWVDKQQ